MQSRQRLAGLGVVARPLLGRCPRHLRLLHRLAEAGERRILLRLLRLHRRLQRRHPRAEVLLVGQPANRLLLGGKARREQAQLAAHALQPLGGGGRREPRLPALRPREQRREAGLLHLGPPGLDHLDRVEELLQIAEPLAPIGRERDLDQISERPAQLRSGQRGRLGRRTSGEQLVAQRARGEHLHAAFGAPRRIGRQELGREVAGAILARVAGGQR